MELGTTSAEDDLLTTDAEVDDEEDGLWPQAFQLFSLL